MSFTQFNRDGHRIVSTMIETELKALGDRLGLKFDVGGGQIGMSDLTIKVKATSNDPATVEKAAREELGLLGASLGLEADDYGATFSNAGKTFKLVAAAPNRPKYPIIGEASNGQRYKFTRGVCNQIIANRTQRQAAAMEATKLEVTEDVGDDDYADAAQF